MFTTAQILVGAALATAAAVVMYACAFSGPSQTPSNTNPDRELSNGRVRTMNSGEIRGEDRWKATKGDNASARDGYYGKALPLFGFVPSIRKTETLGLRGMEGETVSQKATVYATETGSWFHCEMGAPIGRVQPSTSEDVEADLLANGVKIIGVPAIPCNLSISDVLQRMKVHDLENAARWELSYIELQETDSPPRQAMILKVWGVEFGASQFIFDSFWALWYLGSEQVVKSPMGHAVMSSAGLAP